MRLVIGETYNGGLIAEEERFIGQQLRKHLQVLLAKLLNLLGLVDTETLRLHLFAAL